MVCHPRGQCVHFQIWRGLVDRQLSVVSAPLYPCMLPTREPRRKSLKVSASSVFVCYSSSAHVGSKDDGYASGSTRTPTFGRVMSDLHRRDTSLTTLGDPSSKIWGLYLSQAGKFDKEHSESWTANTEGVLFFVRHTSSTTFFSSLLEVCIRPVFSPR